MSTEALAERVGVKWMTHQDKALVGMASQAAPLRACLYHRTGAGKSLTALAGVAQQGAEQVLVISPPSTHDTWLAQGKRLELEVTAISHAKFRMKGFKVSRHMPVIADEFHLFGGHSKAGFTKLDKLAEHLQAPLILASATPNYNDAERVYCVKHILDPIGTRGGYLEFLYANCITEQNPFSMTPNVTGFLNYADAEEFLAALPGVYYLPDEVVFTIDDIALQVPHDREFEDLGYDKVSHRIMASGIEKKHRFIFNSLVKSTGLLNGDAWTILVDCLAASDTPLMVFANHSTVAKAISASLYYANIKHAVVTGDTPQKKKLAYLQAFRDGVLDVLVGTASLATGTDGLDKVCDTLLIVDDTEDDALRRQLIGRIMPRGLDVDATRKKVLRLVLA